MIKTYYSFFLAGVFFSTLQLLSAQSPGLIVRPVNGAGITFLNPNGDAYSSATNAGFTTNDVTQSELQYVAVPPAINEPVGDLLTGPVGGFTDIVPGADGAGFYIYKDATRIYFRLRIGDISSGSKGYSVLIDTDGKIGSSGPGADPNYVAPSGTNAGNPGFEYEVSFQTGVGVVVYNIDGTTNPVQTQSYSLTSNSQISVALSTNSGNPDYFYDWYVPLSAIGNPTSIRVVATTLTSPNSAIAGGRSDIYGINDANYANTALAWQTVTASQPTISLTGTLTVGATCTAPPVLNSPIATGSNVTVTGMWTRLDASKPSTATITLYRNNVAVGTASVTTGNMWSITVPTVAAGDVFYATAMSAGESTCLQSNNVTASGCITPLSAPVLTCANTKGFEGTRVSGATILVYLVPINATAPTSVTPMDATVNYPNATTFQVAGGCSQNQPELETGTYLFVASLGGCTSAPIFECITSASNAVVGLTTNTLAISTPIYPYQTSLTVTNTAANNILRLYINGVYQTSAMATGTSYTFTNLSLSANDQIRIYSQSGTNCMTQSPVFTVSCFTAPPTVTTNTTGNLLTGATTISGTGVPGATVQLYRSPSTAVGTATTVSATGTYSVTVPALVAGEIYYATQTSGGCTSAASSSITVLAPTACPTITGSYTDVSTSVTGAMPSSFTGTIRLYQDGALIGSTTVTNATTWTIAVPASNPLYFNGVLTATAQATGNTESTGCTTNLVGCTAPATPTVTPTTTAVSVQAGGTVTFTVSNVTANTFYSLLDANGVSYATSQYRTTAASFMLTTNVLTPGIYSLRLTADRLTGCPETFATINITVTLPVEFIRIDAIRTPDGALISWQVTNEVNVAYYDVERSTDGSMFAAIGRLDYRVPTGPINEYTFTDLQPGSAARHYFRIRQVDHDGAFQYSTTVTLENEAKHGVIVAPNPVRGRLRLLLTVPDAQNARLELLDLHGRTVLEREFAVERGVNTLEADLWSGLASGTYLVKVYTADGVLVRKVLLGP
jgi:hypothetical protein